MDYADATKEEEQNTVALKPLAPKGFVIELREAVNKQNVKTADAPINGEVTSKNSSQNVI